MTQKKIGDILYVFAGEAYEITQDTTATTIFVQEELVPAFKTANSSLASKIMPYNYSVMHVTKLEWEDYIDAEDPTGETGEPTGETGEPTGETGEPTGETGEPTGEQNSTAEVETTGETGEPTGPTGQGS